MLGMADVWTALGYLMTILSVIFCIAYGVWKWRG
ncbi:hypothetical protein Asulf_02168 [Archaeoglobus sulfaticallidus PM70-1]|uniref:Uncharacterized protein n=1 Tax=Archaeoglobus sulfaticallidus PM70-1 TaxID=387631 RepID=N0BII8_9EURY|nr:hypothetical protein Asulf_02168 [Archaeoglobus sulfaticallidus PM70-1]